MDSASAQTINLPDGLPSGFWCVIVKVNTGDTEITADTTFNGTNGGSNISLQYGGVTVYHVGSNVFEGIGNLDLQNSAPIINNIVFSGTAEEGETLTITFVYSDADGDLQDISGTGTQFDLKRHPTQLDADNDTNGTIIDSGATLHASQITYQLTNPEVNEFISVGFTPKAQTGNTNGLEVRASLTGAISAAPAAAYPSNGLRWRVNFTDAATMDTNTTDQAPKTSIKRVRDTENSKEFTNVIATQNLLQETSASSNAHLVAVGNVSENGELRGLHDANVNIPSGSAFSLVCCIRVTALGVRQIFHFKGVSSTSSIQYMLEVQTDNSFRFHWNGTTLAVNESGFLVAGDLNTETTIILTYDNTDFKLYKNGTLVATIPDATGIGADVSNDAWIGGSNTGNIKNTTEISGSAVHTAALLASEVTEAHDFLYSETGN